MPPLLAVWYSCFFCDSCSECLKNRFMADGVYFSLGQLIDDHRVPVSAESQVRCTGRKPSTVCIDRVFFFSAAAVFAPSALCIRSVFAICCVLWDHSFQTLNSGKPDSDSAFCHLHQHRLHLIISMMTQNLYL